MSEGCDEVQTLRAQLDDLRRQIGWKDEALARKNRELDALHYVWCSGGCTGGVHRWGGSELTEDIVQEAERNTQRLRMWWSHRKTRERQGTL